MGHFNIIQLIIIWAPPVLFAITLHEVAHGWVARRLGDPTAHMLGRLTLNPLKHIDPVGTIIVPAVLFASMMLFHTGFLFGWAKPVPIAPRNFKHPRRGMAIVAVAGPLANLAMGIFWAIIMRLAFLLHPSFPWIDLLIYMGFAGVSINIVLLVFNLIPLPPLDGGRVLVGLLPRNAANVVDRIEPYGFYIIILLLFIGAFNVILTPPIMWLSQLLLPGGLIS
ncbi:MAG: site-2 protease family protein [Gammaproteobacteria bacterium]